MQASIPVKMYVVEQMAFPDNMKNSASIVFPETQLKRCNSNANPGAKVIHLVYDAAKKAAEAEREKALTIQSYPWTALCGGGKKCGNCAHFDRFYREDKLHPGTVVGTSCGKCHLKGVTGRQVKASGTCDSFTP